MRAPNSLPSKPRRLAAACLTIALMAGCSAGAGSSRSSAPAPTASKETPTVQAINVEILEFKFLPDVQTVSAGTTVSWVNSDPYFHTVTSGKTDGPVNEPDGVFDSGLKNKGDVINITFDKPGTYTYFCKQHNAMNGEIRVS